jgi:hypothetical protein
MAAFPLLSFIYDSIENVSFSAAKLLQCEKLQNKNFKKIY